MVILKKTKHFKDSRGVQLVQGWGGGGVKLPFPIETCKFGHP